MFLIKAKEQNRLWSNGLNDDFIRFLPKELNCLPSDLKIFYIKDSVKEEIEQHCSVVDNFVNLENGEVSFCKSIKEMQQVEVEGEMKEVEVIKEIVTLTTKALTPLVSSWPYEEVEGKLIFKGIQLGA
jgi:hypothetical protein